MKESKCRQTSIALSHIVHRLYGDKPYRMIKHWHNVSEARKYYLRIMRSMRLTIEENLTITDRMHRQQLLELIEREEKFIRTSKSFNELDQQMVAFLIEMFFLLVGLSPNRWRKENVANIKANWKLNDYRQIQYVQTPEQKERVILGAIQTRYPEIRENWSDFVLDIYWKECNYEPEKLIEWFKQNHPDMYMELF